MSDTSSRRLDQPAIGIPLAAGDAMTEPPFVSIVMPARNEEAHIGKALASIAAVDYPRSRIEVIVVDNGSSDATARIAQAHGARVLSSSARTVGQVRNAGAAIATGDIIAFVDADCIVPADWLRAGTAALASQGIGAVGNDRCRAPADAGWIERAWAGAPPAQAVTVPALATSSFIVRRELFERLGGFDMRLGAGEDDDLSARIRRAGYTLLALPACTVSHLDYPNTLFRVMTRQLWHGRSQLQTSRGIFDRLLILTHLFAVCMGAGVAAVAIFPRAGVSLLLTTVGFALIAAWARSGKAPRKSVASITGLALVMWFFLLGRSFGLALNYVDILSNFLTSTRPVRNGKP